MMNLRSAFRRSKRSWTQIQQRFVANDVELRESLEIVGFDGLLLGLMEIVEVLG